MTDCNHCRNIFNSPAQVCGPGVAEAELVAAAADYSDRIGASASSRSRAAAAGSQGPLRSLHLVSLIFSLILDSPACLAQTRDGMQLQSHFLSKASRG